MKKLTRPVRPDFVVDTVANLTAADIARLSPGIRAVALDIDGTITDYHAPSVPPDAVARLASYREAGLRTFIISNCYGPRTAEVHRLFDPHVDRVFTPADCLDPADPKDRPTRHRKPAPDMLLAAARWQPADAPGPALRPGEILMVGDQLLKDVLAGRRAGTASVLVPRLGRSDHLGVRILQRPLERVLRVVLGLPVARRAWPTALAPTP